MSSPIGARLREMALRPGEKIDPAAFLKDPEVAAYVGQITRLEQTRLQRDWSGLCRYRTDNAALKGKAPPTLIMLGDSITDNWILGDPGFFSDKVVDRGISGQTTSQILLRFYPDVVALRPKVVHIMAGANDILHDTGTVGDDDIINNINAMIDIAEAHHIKVVLASILPISVRAWQPDLHPAQRVRQLNARLAALAAAHKLGFVDYHAAMVDSDGGLRADLGNDGVHPNRAGYSVMRGISAKILASAGQRKH